MTEQRAREILGEQITADGRLDPRVPWPNAPRKPGPMEVYLEDTYSADELEAIAWWMRNKP
jgi:hypothetical protein